MVDGAVQGSGPEVILGPALGILPAPAPSLSSRAL